MSVGVNVYLSPFFSADDTSLVTQWLLPTSDWVQRERLGQLGLLASTTTLEFASDRFVALTPFYLLNLVYAFVIPLAICTTEDCAPLITSPLQYFEALRRMWGLPK